MWSLERGTTVKTVHATLLVPGYQLLYSSPSYERQKSPQTTVSQKGFALFGGQSGSALVPDYPPNKANPF